MTLPHDDPWVTQSLAALEEKRGQRQALRASARHSIDGSAGSARLKERLVVARPAFVRSEILGLLQQVAAVLTTDGKRFQLLDLSRSDFQQGPVDRQLLFQLAGVDLMPDELVAILLGTPPIPDDAKVTEVEKVASDDSLNLVVYLDSKRAGGRSALRFDPALRLLAVDYWDELAVLRWQLRYMDYKPVGESEFAHQVDLFFSSF